MTHISFSFFVVLDKRRGIFISGNCKTEFVEFVFRLTEWIHKERESLFLNWVSMVLDG